MKDPLAWTASVICMHACQHKICTVSDSKGCEELPGPRSDSTLGPARCTRGLAIARRPARVSLSCSRTDWCSSTTHLLPSRDLVVVPDAGDVGHPARLRGDVRGLGDEERAGDAGALRVVLNDEVCGDVRDIVT